MMMRMFPVMRALDKNEDGMLSKEEIENAAAALKALDKNKDGKLDGEELRSQFPGRGGFGGGPGERGGRPQRPGGDANAGRGGDEAMVERVMALDKNKDGKISADEAGERMAGLMRRADEDKDGVVTRSELEAAMRNRRGGQRPGGERGSGAMIDRLLSENDKNKDGKLTADELPERMKRLAERADANNDGAVDKAELEKVMSRRGVGGGEGERGRPGRRGGGRSDRPERPGGDDK